MQRYRLLPRSRTLLPLLFLQMNQFTTLKDPPSGIYNAPAAGNSSYVRNEEHPAPVREIVVSGDDQITREYMDYGRYEQNSPAALAVKNVKEKLQKREKEKNPGYRSTGSIE